MMNYRYRTDNEMKDSGVEWLGNIPKKWEKKKLKRCISEVKGGIWGEEEKKDINDIECIRITNFNRNKNIINLENLTIRNLDVNKQKEYLLRKGDLLIEKSGGGEKQPVGFVSIYNHNKKVIYANFMSRLRVFLGNDSNFINYMFKTMYNKKINLKAFNQTTGIQNLNISKYIDEIISICNNEEQQKIVSFLDKKTAEFDSIIDKKQTLIKKLSEAKKSLISEVVTGKKQIIEERGQRIDNREQRIDGQEYRMINRADDEMKDSGVEWLGMIPRDWDVKRLKNVIELTMGQSPDSESIIEDNNGMPFYQGKTEFGKLYPIPKNYCNAPKKKANLEEILISVRAPVGDLNLTNSMCCIGRGLASIKPKTNKMFLFYLLNIAKKELVSYATGSTFEAISTEQLKNIKISTTTIQEQKLIASFLDEKTSKIDITIEKTKLQIEKLKEAKQSLISEAVTGKIEVL